MNALVSCMQSIHAALAYPAVRWVRVNLWCAVRWERLRNRIVQVAPEDSDTMGDRG